MEIKPALRPCKILSVPAPRAVTEEATLQHIQLFLPLFEETIHIVKQEAPYLDSVSGAATGTVMHAVPLLEALFARIAENPRSAVERGILIRTYSRYNSPRLILNALLANAWPHAFLMAVAAGDGVTEIPRMSGYLREIFSGRPVEGTEPDWDSRSRCMNYPHPNGKSKWQPEYARLFSLAILNHLADNLMITTTRDLWNHLHHALRIAIVPITKPTAAQMARAYDVVYVDDVAWGIMADYRMLDSGLRQMFVHRLHGDPDIPINRFLLSHLRGNDVG